MAAGARRGRQDGGARLGEVPAAARGSPRRLADSKPHDSLELLGHRAALGRQERLTVGAVAIVGKLAQRFSERVRVGEVGQRERFGQHGRERRRVVVQPASHPRGTRRPRVCLPVEQVAEREQITQVDRWLQLDAGQRELQLPVEQRVDPSLGGQQRLLAGDADRVGPRELGAAQLARRAVRAAARVGQQPAVILLPSPARTDLWHAIASRAAPDEERLVADANDAPAKLPAQPPRTVGPQAVRTEPRAPDQHLMPLRRAGQRNRRRDCGPVKRQTRIPSQQHPLESGRLDPGRERDPLEPLRRQTDAVATGCRDAARAAVKPKRPDQIARRELKGVRVARDIARQALPVDRAEPERQRPHAAARRGCWRPAPTSAA